MMKVSSYTKQGEMVNSDVVETLPDDELTEYWTDTSEEKRVIVGLEVWMAASCSLLLMCGCRSQATAVPITAPYTRVFPLRDPPSGSTEAALSALLRHVVRDKLAVTRDMSPVRRKKQPPPHAVVVVCSRTRQRVGAVLVVGDAAGGGPQTAELVRFLLGELQLGAVMLAHEAACAAFGAGVPSACVVRLGATRTTVACVEDGMVLAASRCAVPRRPLLSALLTFGRVTLPYGGEDVLRALAALLTAPGRRFRFPFPRDPGVPRSLADGVLRHMLADVRDAADMSQEVEAVLATYFAVRRPTRPGRQFRANYTDEALVALTGVFHPALLAHAGALAPRQAAQAAHIAVRAAVCMCLCVVELTSSGTDDVAAGPCRG
jgi:hypothetical protein